MGNTPLSSQDTAFAYGKSTQQIDGVLTLKKQSAPTWNTKQRRRGLLLPWHSSEASGNSNSRNNNKNVKSLLMRSILARDWQKVLIRARLFPSEVHEFAVLEVPLPVSRERPSRTKNNATATSKGKTTDRIRWVKYQYCRVKVLPVHAACALRPPPEVVRALLSHSVGSSMLSNAWNGKGGFQNSKGNPKTNRRASERPQQLSRLVPLYHEHNISLATVTVERREDSSLGRAIVDKLYLLGEMARRGSRHEKSGGKLRLLCSTTEEEDSYTNDGSGNGDNREENSDVVDRRSDPQNPPRHRENEKDVALFLKQMEDHLAHNGRCKSRGRDANHHPRSESSNSSLRRRSSRSIFVLDFDPSVLLPSPSAVRVTEKQNRAQNPIGSNHFETDLFSLENSIGDSETAMTTSTPQLVGNNSRSRSRRNGKDSEESSSLEYLTDESFSDSSASSSELQSPPGSDCDDPDDSSNGSNSFLQLTADGGLTLVDLQGDENRSGDGHTSDDSNANGHCHSDEGPLVTTSSSESSGTCASSTTNTDSRPSSGSCSNSRVSNDLPKFVPEDIRLSYSALIQSLPRVLSRKRGQENRKAKKGQGLLQKPHSRKQGHHVCGLSRLFPLHIACLYGASASVLNILLQEYPAASSIEVLGMLPVHMVAANWSLAATEESLRTTIGDDDSCSIECFDSETDRLTALVEGSPRSLLANSSAHGLRPLEYTRILLCYPENASDEGMLGAMDYLDFQEKRHNLLSDGRVPRKHARGTVEHPKRNSLSNETNNDDYDIYGNHPVDSTYSCTTSGISSAWMANDSSSVYSSPASNSPKKSHISLGGLLSQGRWGEAMLLLETNPEKAEERYHSSSTNDRILENNCSGSATDRCIGVSFSSGWKGQLLIHMACQIFQKGSSIPFSLVRLLVSSYPEGLKQTDDEISESLPLHLICDSFRRHRERNVMGGLGSGEDHRFFVSERLKVLRLLLAEHPLATRIADRKGRLPLHKAILVGAPFEAIQLLVYRYPKAIALPDRDGRTPFCLSKKIYTPGSSVTKLLQLAWI